MILCDLLVIFFFFEGVMELGDGLGYRELKKLDYFVFN